MRVIRSFLSTSDAHHNVPPSEVSPLGGALYPSSPRGQLEFKASTIRKDSYGNHSNLRVYTLRLRESNARRLDRCRALSAVRSDPEV